MSMFLTKDLSEMIDDLYTVFGFTYCDTSTHSTPKEKIELELPGIKKEDIELKLKGEFVYLKWKDRKGQNRGASYLVGKIDDIEATYENGLLVVKAIKIKKEKEEAKEIKIKGA